MNITTRLTLLILVTIPLCARAADVSYGADFYAAFAPRTALDMVRQTPGFVLAEEEADARRGYSGAVGNVLVDGRRLSAKSQSLVDVLQRIPAAEVTRIELLRGAEVSGDASGAAVIANVIRTRGSGGGAWALGTELANRGKPAPNGWFGWGGRRGLTDYSLGGMSYSLQRDLPGRREVRDGEGDLAALRRSASPREFEEYGLNGQLSRPAGGGSLSITGQAHTERYHENTSVQTWSPAGDRRGDELTPYTERKRTGELGVGWGRSVGLWSIDLTALATRKHFDSDVANTQRDVNSKPTGTFSQSLARASAESILRGTGSRVAAGGRFEVGAEFALNTLDGRMRLAFDAGTGPTTIPVANGNLSIEESRAEVFVSQSQPLGATWSLDARLAAEHSVLDFSGDTNQSVSLNYVKPRLQLTRRFGAHQVQARVYRDVGQLDFTDFVSAAEVADDVIRGGNPRLRPQTAWAAEIEADLRFQHDAAVRARLFHHELDDVVDFVPVGTAEARVDAAGNIGRGRLTGVEVTARLPLAPLLPGGSLKASGTFQDAEVRDPVTRRLRPISELPVRKYVLELREDLPTAKFAWGMTFTDESESVVYRLRERDASRKSRQLDAFVETTAARGLTVRLTMLSVLDDGQRRQRSFYLPDRGGELGESERSVLQPGHWWLLSVSGSL